MRFREHLLVVSSAALIAVLVGAVPAVAQVQWTDDELTQFSDVIAHGNVVGVESRWDYEVDAIYTHVTIELRDVMKGAAQSGEFLEIKQLGGQVGNLVMGIGGQAYFVLGEEAVFFLETRPRDGTFYTSALWQGKFLVERTTDNPDGMAVRSATANLAAPGGGSSYVVDSRVLRPWKEEIRAWTSTRARPRRDAWFDPFDMPALPAIPTFSDWFDDDLESGFGEFTNLDPAKPRWHGGTVASTWHKKGEKLTPGKGHTQVAAAAAAWKNRRSSIAIVAKKGRVTRRKGCSYTFTNDLKILVSFKDRCRARGPQFLREGFSLGGEISNTGGTLGIGGGFWFPGAPFSRFAHGFVITNSDHPGFTAFFRSVNCFQALIMHEYGHAIGLGHSPKRRAIMFASTAFPRCVTTVPKIGRDDKRGIKRLYPKPFR